MKQICIYCKIEKPLDNEHFPVHKRKKLGFDSRCIECKRLYDKNRYLKKRDKILEQKRKYYQRKKQKTAPKGEGDDLKETSEI